MTAPIQGTVSREFKTYKNENDGNVRAHVVTDDTVGTVNEAYVGRTRDAVVGDVLIESGRTDQYIFSARDEFASRYTEEDGGSAETDDAEDGSFDPNEKDAATVRDYLNRVKRDGDTEEYDRVVAAEKRGKNRSTAIPVV